MLAKFAILTSLLAVPASAATARGLAWATNDNFAGTLGSTPKVTWYHHWQDGPVKQMPAKNEYVPMFWGPKKWDLWEKRKSEMNKKLPKNLLAFNEPDIPSQANMNPGYAADIYMQEIVPWGRRGVKLGSPSIAFDLNWMQKFLDIIHSRGGWVDYITVHWYGSHKDIAGFKKYIQAVHKKFGRDIWVTELGVTSASKPSEYDTKQFMMQAYAFMDSTGYVRRASWFGCFLANSAPDAYATGKNALFRSGNPNGPAQMSDRGYWYGYSDHPDRRRALTDSANSSHLSRQISDDSDIELLERAPEPVAAPAPVELHSRHARIAANLAKREEEEDDDTPEIDCDELCKLRAGVVAEWEKTLASA